MQSTHCTRRLPLRTLPWPPAAFRTVTLPGPALRPGSCPPALAASDRPGSLRPPRLCMSSFLLGTGFLALRSLCLTDSSLGFFKIFFLSFLLAALVLRCCTRAFSSCGERGLLFVAVHGLLIAVASLCRGAQALGMRAAVVVACGLSSCGSRALERRLSSCGARA